MHTEPRRGTRSPRSARGFTLTELMVSFSVLMIVLLGFSRMLLSSQMASSTTHEATLAKEAARSMVEVLQASRLSAVYATYNSDPADDPGAPGSAPGTAFDVRGLEAPLGDADGRVGQILFPELNGELTENLNVPQYGWVDLDLNGDGDHDDADVSDDYKYLPVLVRVAWNGAGGPGSVEFKTLIANF
jgi:type II secretory pathway pseudopilin PulG